VDRAALFEEQGVERQELVKEVLLLAARTAQRGERLTAVRAGRSQRCLQ
jgi:hypothetical protein